MPFFFGLSWTRILAYGAAVLPLWVTGTVIYRRYLHPLAKIPGPFLASITRLYSFYFNVNKGGVFYLEVQKLHEIYGPVVRIAPNEVHLDDPDNYDKIYTVGTKFYKARSFYGALGDQTGMFSTASNELHRRRRSPLNPFFSRRAVLELEDMVQAKAAKLCDRVQDGLDKGQAVNLHDGFRAVSMDVITDYAFDDCWNQLEREDMGAWFSDMVKNAGRTFWIMQQFPFLLKPMKSIPPKYAKKISPAISDMVDTQMRTRRVVEEVQARIENGEKPRQRTIFHQRLDPSVNEPGYEKPTIRHMSEEAFSLCTAASDTTGNAMTVATFHLLQNPLMLAALQAELREAFPEPTDKLPYTTLEKLPYLSSVIKEGQRLSYGVVSRLPRVTPEGGATFNGYFVPEGAIVGMSSYLMHRNEVAFPDPEKFDPTRWIGGDAEAVRAREKCFVAFSRGSRMCIGQNLALCELYVTLGTFFHRFDGSLRPQYVGPLTYVDFFNIYHPTDEQKLRVRSHESVLVL